MNDKKMIIKKIINIVLDILIVLLGIILLITIYNNIQVNILGNDYASFFGHSVFEVQTGSMEPEISAGDWIIVKYDNTIRLNDIVTFEHNDEYITHRVIETYNQTFVTKGDANTAKDSPITKDQIIGKVTKILPNFGILRKTIFNPIVLIFLIITCYIAGLTFKEPTDKEIEVEKELLDKIKNKLQPIKEKVMPLEIKVEEEEVLLQEPVIEQIEDTGEFEIIKKKKEKKKVEQPVVEELVEEPATEETKEEPVIEETESNLFFDNSKLEKEQIEVINDTSDSVQQPYQEENITETSKKENSEKALNHETIVAFSPLFFETINNYNKQSVLVRYIDSATNKYLELEKTNDISLNESVKTITDEE